MVRQSFNLAAIVFISLTLASCAFFKDRYGQKPEVQLQQVNLKDATFSGATLVFVLAVKNPNKADLKIDSVDYEILLDGEQFAKTTIDTGITLKAQATTPVGVPLPFQYGKLVGGVVKFLSGEDVTYVFAGTAKVSGFKIPFNEKGKINLQELAKKH